MFTRAATVLRWGASALVIVACGSDDATPGGGAAPTPVPAGQTAPTPQTPPDGSTPPTPGPGNDGGALPSVGFAVGTNLAVAEFGGDKIPGVINTDYAYPTHAEVDYFTGKGMKILRLPFLWERLQPTAKGDLDAGELGRIDDFVNYATGTKGAFVLVDPHNYARYKGKVIGVDVDADVFADLWTKLATHFASNEKVVFGLMNEPHDIPTTTWRDDANAAIAAIRAAKARNVVFVPGNNYTGAHAWTTGDHGDVMLGIVDSLDNYVYEVHQYLDSDNSGSHPDCASATIGAERIASFVTWAEANHKRGFLGETGIASNDTCNSALGGMLTAMEAKKNVWVGWTYWAAGPWWGDYIYSLEPKDGVDKPQMSVLAPHIPAP